MKTIEDRIRDTQAIAHEVAREFADAVTTSTSPEHMLVWSKSASSVVAPKARAFLLSPESREAATVTTLLASIGELKDNETMRSFVSRSAAADVSAQDDPEPDVEQHGHAEPKNSMNTPTREEFEARIAASEARSDARFIAFEKRVDESMHRIELELAPLKNIKISIWGAAATIIATFVAVFAIYVSAFDSGRETSKMAADAQAIAARAQQETVAALTQIRQIASDLKAAQPPAVDAPPSSPPKPQQ